MDIPVVVNDLPLIISDTPKGCLFIYKDSITENTFTSLDWFEKECLLHACTLKGRKDAFRKITGTSQKPAILLSEIDRILYFPLLGEKAINNIYIQYEQVVKIKSISYKKTRIYFINGYQYDVNYNHRIIKLQLQKCEQFLKRI